MGAHVCGQMCHLLNLPAMVVSFHIVNESTKVFTVVFCRLNNVAHATNAKGEIEQRQRIEAQRRKEAGVMWQTKVFIKIICNFSIYLLVSWYFIMRVDHK